MNNKFTVISVDSQTGQIYSDHCFAHERNFAFSCVAIMDGREDAEFVCSLDGHLIEGEHIDYAGTAVVSAETVLEQSDIFGMPS
jgi:hypothetical protein